MQYRNEPKPEYDELTQVCHPHYEIVDGVFVSGWKIEDKPVEEEYIPDTPETIDPIAERIAVLKRNLRETDYIIIKIAEGVVTHAEYAERITQRQAWRAEIHELEEMQNAQA